MPSEIPSDARIKAVFFDAAGTLIKPARRVGESYAAIAAKYGMAVTPAELFERFRICFDGAPPLAFPGAAAAEIEPLERQWWRQLVAQVFEPWGEFAAFDDFFDELFAYFARADAWLLYPEVDRDPGGAQTARLDPRGDFQLRFTSGADTRRAQCRRELRTYLCLQRGWLCQAASRESSTSL